jgi:lipopolysaccharide/colanic/teichoic acid biosynthesis glycosyltransferase
MSATIEESRVSHAQPVILPEPIGSTASAFLAAGDLISAIVASIVALLLARDAHGAIVVLLVAFIVAVLIGRYRKSFAIRSSDEMYGSAAIALLAAPIGIVLSHVLGYGEGSAFVGILVWTLLAGAFAGYALRLRRGSQRTVEAGVDRVHEWKRRRPAVHLERTVIRALDLGFASIALVVLSPLMAFIAVVVLADGGRPVLFRQVRVGEREADFTILKFRTMRPDAGQDWVKPGDARITRVGAFLRRTSLDELPQLVNVLRGDMSLVGPRPEMRDYAVRFSLENPSYWQRHMVPPGISGWAQLNLPRNLQPSDMPQVLRYDLFYVQNGDIYLYNFCLAKTALEVFMHRAV